jgi:hypothetical protein
MPTHIVVDDRIGAHQRSDVLDQIGWPEGVPDQGGLDAGFQSLVVLLAVLLAVLGVEIARGDHDDRNVAPAGLLAQGGDHVEAVPLALDQKHARRRCRRSQARPGSRASSRRVLSPSLSRRRHCERGFGFSALCETKATSSARSAIPQAGHPRGQVLQFPTETWSSRTVCEEAHIAGHSNGSGLKLQTPQTVDQGAWIKGLGGCLGVACRRIRSEVFG